MIEINNLQWYTKEKIIDLLLEQKTQPFEIYIPKSTQLYFSEPNAIWLDYIYLAYSGQILKNVSTEFSYEEISPESNESVLFEINAKNIEALAGAILEISYGYVNDSDDEEFNYTEYADDYVDRAQKQEFIPACPYFIEVCSEMGKEEDEEDI